MDDYEAIYKDLKSKIVELPVIGMPEDGVRVAISDGTEDMKINGIECTLHFFKIWSVTDTEFKEEKIYENGMYTVREGKK